MRTAAAPRPSESTARPPRRVALAQAREAVRGFVAQGRSDEAVEFLLAALAAVLAQSAELEVLIAKLRRAGTRSERTDPGQLALLFEQLLALGGDDGPPLDPEAEAREDAAMEHEIAAAAAAAACEAAGAPAPVRRRWRTTDAVERQVHVHDVPLADRPCPTCGGVRRPMGVDVTHALEFVPGHFVEHEHQVAKYACGRCKDTVTTAAAPAKVLPRSAADASLLAHVVVSKYVDHCPLHRVQRVYARSGATIPVSTLADWVGEVGTLVMPLVEVLAARVRGATVVNTDATGLRVLDPTSPANIAWGTMWCYIGDRDVVFRYAPDGDGATGPWAFLAGRRGYIQADAASVFDRLYTGDVASATEVGCWAHGRRRLVALEETDCRVAYPIKLIARLYRIERLADVQQLDAAGRTALRQDRAPPLLASLQRWLVATLAAEPPSSDLAKAGRYLVNQWTALTRFVEDGRLALDNNRCEQQLRDIALGRKNYLFAGSHEAARRAAALYSLMRTCALHGVPPLPYLTDVLRRISTGDDAARLVELLPDRWLAAQHADRGDALTPPAPATAIG